MHWTYRVEYVRCGKGCRGCPHGPYWYRYRKHARRTVKEYVGRVCPEQENPAFPQAFAEHDSRADILCKQLANVHVACSILGIDEYNTFTEARIAYVGLVKKHHPDRGGDATEFVLISAAWSWLCIARAWK